MSDLSIEPVPAVTRPTNNGNELQTPETEPPALLQSGPELPEHTAGPMGPPKKRTKFQLTAIMSMVYFSVFLAAVDTTITTTAVPTIASYFNSSAGYTWIGSAYLLALAASSPTWGKVSDIFGRKPAMLSALGVFFFGSLLCGAATSMTMLIAGRAIQGTGGGGILLVSNVVTSDLFSMRSRGMILSFESLTYALAAGVGPVLGGTFSELISWRWCFYMTAPCSGLAFIALAIFLDLQSPRTPIIAGLKAIDWLGSLSVIGATISLLLGLEFGGVIFAWDSVKVILLLIVGFSMAIFFLYNEKRWAGYPVMPLRLFHSRSNVAALVVGFLHAFTFFAPSYYLPLYAQSVLGYSPIHSGLFILPFEVSLSLASAACGVIIKVTGHYIPQLHLGFGLLTISMALLIIFTKLHTPLSVFIIIELIGGIGAGLTCIPPPIALLAGVLVKDNATALGTFRFLHELAAAISIVLGGVVFQNVMQAQHTHLVVEVGSDVAGMFTGKAAASNVLLVAGLGDAQKDVVRTAYAMALSRMWILFLVTAAVALIVGLLIRKRNWSSVHEEGILGLDVKSEVLPVGGEVPLQVREPTETAALTV